MSIEQISLPKGVGPQAMKLWDAITQAGSAAELNRAGGKAEGFVLGLKAPRPSRVRSLSRCTWPLMMPPASAALNWPVERA